MIKDTNAQFTTEPANSGKRLLCAGAVSKDGISLIHGDCLQALKSYGDNYFDVAIVDPPYGIGFSSKKQSNFGKGGINHEYKGWDEEIPKAEYWEQLFRVSKNQIVWGANYMTEFLKPSRCWISWYKMQEFSTNEFELAWTSFDGTCKQFNLSRVQAYAGSNKIHPTEKPIKLYKWLLENYTSEGDLILDTHLGSGSIAIACHQMKRKLIGYEIDADYYQKACKRFEEQTRQTALW